ncbi:hypothetical protein AB0M71_48790, partial [Amycolatopsis sp. NPDC051114]
MRSGARTTTARRTRTGLIGLGTAAGFALIVPGAAYADPVGCTRVFNGSGDTVTCTAGIPAGQILTGTAGNDVVAVTGAAMSGTINALAGNDTITMTGTAGTTGAPGGAGGTGTSTSPAGFAG